MHPSLRLPLIPPGPVGGVVLLLGAATALRLGLLHTPLLSAGRSVVATMGLEVLRGGLPVYYHGQPFMGALHAYLAAPLYVLLGPSAFAIELLSVLVTVAWLLVMARLAWVTFGPRVALVATALLALPPNLLLYWSHEARPQYLLTLLFGTLALLLARDLPALSPARATLAVTLVGGLLGLAAWTNFLAVVYGPALALLVVPAVVRRRLFGARAGRAPRLRPGEPPALALRAAARHGAAEPRRRRRRRGKWRSTSRASRGCRGRRWQASRRRGATPRRG